jgi:membrane protease YdiL (CAAX protease family)
MPHDIAMEKADKRGSQAFILASPLILLAANYLTARLGLHFLGSWAWLPFQIEYWLLLALLIHYGGGWQVVRRAYRRPTKWGWWIPCILVGFLPLPVLLFNRGLIHQPVLIVSWLLIAVLNPFFEESYWRCLFGEATEKWPVFLACLYPTLFFTLAHPLGFGVFSIGCRSVHMLLSLIAMGALWSFVYRKTQSLQAITVSHILVDLFNMSVWVYMNILIPKNSF